MPDEFDVQLREVLPLARKLLDAADGEDLDDEEGVLERGETLLRLYRHGKREQLRVVFDEFCGQRFATIRVWFRDPEDRDLYLPTGRGVTVRRRELLAVIAALTDIATRLGTDSGEGASTESSRGGPLP